MSFTLSTQLTPSPDQEKAIQQIVSNIDNKVNKQTLLGVTGSGKTFVMANAIARTNRPTLVLSHNKTLAAQLYEEFVEFFPDNAVRYFVSYYDYYQPEAYIPGKDLYIEKESDINNEIERMRHSAMYAALTRKDVIIVASVSCIYNIGNPENYQGHSITMKVGDSFPISKLSRDLVLMQYQRDLTDFTPSSFRIKGDIVDIFTPYHELPIRLKFFGDELEEINYIDALTGQKLAQINKIEIFPSRTFIFDYDVVNKAAEEIRKDMEIQVEALNKMGKIVEAQRLKQRTTYDIEMLLQVGYCKGMENYSIYFEDRQVGDPPYTLMDYFPDDYLLFIDESHITVPQIGGMSKGDAARKETLIEYGFRLPTARDNRPLNFEEFRQRQGVTTYVSATPTQWEIKDSDENVVELLTRPTGLLDPIIDVRPTMNQIDDVIAEVNANIKKRQRVLITTLTKRMAEDLSAYLEDMDIRVHYLHSDQDTVERVDVLRKLRLGEFDVLVGINLLREGIDLPEVSLVIILDADKEGYLRSRTSLVQTIGRAARHQEGRVLLYADKETDSMKYAITETRRRRKFQEEYNTKHGITPTTIQKGIRESLKKDEIDDTPLDYAAWIEESKPPKSKVKSLIKDLEDKMFIAAENLQFEKAAEIRDQIKDLKNAVG
ncbi:MAG: excinuclease ABC subunit UvrB [Candidatus Dojkabacteria bacterium]|nr:MAG: excinuclease ABC subunit UvrB [Candidatus Dojkabacteria bacterium]